MLESFSVPQSAAKKFSIYEEIESLLGSIVHCTFSAIDRRLIQYAEGDPALRSFLDRSFGVRGIASAEPHVMEEFEEEFSKFPPSEQLALKKAILHRAFYEFQASSVFGIMERLPSPSSFIH